MPVVGNIQKAGTNIQFLCARTESGSPLETPREISEELTSAGVDGRRWRTLYKMHPEFTLSTVTECSAYSVAISQRNKAEGLTNKLVDLVLTIDGNVYLFGNVHVNAVLARAVAGVVIASGSTGGAAHLMCEWSLTMTDFTQVVKS
jgi:hypothetical protein